MHLKFLHRCSFIKKQQQQQQTITRAFSATESQRTEVEDLQHLPLQGKIIPNTKQNLIRRVPVFGLEKSKIWTMCVQYVLF